MRYIPEVSSEVEKLIQDICKEYSLGIKIEQVVLQDVNPPEPVKAAFNAVNEAQQEKSTLINKAKSEYNKVIPKARGQAKETIQKAEGYATERINTALGEAARFDALYKEYVKAPEVTRERIYLETMSDVLPKLGNKYIIDPYPEGMHGRVEELAERLGDKQFVIAGKLSQKPAELYYGNVEKKMTQEALDDAKDDMSYFIKRKTYFAELLRRRRMELVEEDDFTREQEIENIKLYN